jgi:hypothetical protein
MKMNTPSNKVAKETETSGRWISALNFLAASAEGMMVVTVNQRGAYHYALQKGIVWME